MALKIKIGNTILPETINLDGKEARLIIFPRRKKWCMEYVHFDPEKQVFNKFKNEFFRCDTIEEAAISMKAGLKNHGYIK